MPSIRLFSLLILSACIFASCQYDQKLAYRKHHSLYVDYRMGMLAWNEDTINDCRVVLYRDRTFSYGVRNGNQKATQYYGRYAFSADTIYLLFRGTQPPMCPYLIREISGSYLVQYFKDGRRRIFLRLQAPPLMRG